MNNLLNHVLRDTFHLANVRLFGRACSGLYSILIAIKEEFGAGSVIVPSICCPSVVYSILYAGLKPVFVDVRLEDFTIDPESIKEMISQDTRAILAVHIFGHICDISSIRRIAPNTIIIEDCAQGFQRTFENGNFPSSGDFILFSFGQSKIIKGKGGALGIRNKEWNTILERTDSSHFNQHDPALEYMLGLSFRDWSEGLIAIMRENSALNFSPVFHQLADNFKPLFLKPYRATEANETSIIKQLKELDAILERRFEKARYYYDSLAKTGVFMPRLDEKNSYWRFSFLLANTILRRELTFLLREKKLLVSNHYFPLEKLFENKFRKNSGSMAGRTMNLFCSDIVLPEDQERIVKTIEAFMETHC